MRDALAARPIRRLGLDPSTWIAMAMAVAAPALLLAFIGADPTSGVTGSLSPFTDEAWNVMNARNLALLGTWSTDEFNLHLVNGPFSLIEAAVFSVLGVGIVQARLVSIVSVGLTTLILAIGLRGPLGRGPALLAAASFGTCVLVLYYGRLAYPETLAMLEMTAGMVLVGQAREGTSGRWGLLAGILFGLAIATKANALFGLVGGIAAFAIVEGTAGAVRRWLVAALIGLTIVASVWLVAVFIPFHGAVMTDISIWPHQAAPDSVGELFRRIAGYAFRSDAGLPGLAPIAVAAGIGVVATAAGRRTLSPAARALAVAAMGWIAIQLAVLLVVSYRPNRYLLPLLPAAAILVGVGASVIHQHLRRAGGRRPVTRALAAFAIAALVLPGLISYAGWMSRATHVLGPTQEAAARLLPRGATVWGGFAPLLAMKAEVTTIVPWPAAPANVGPSYQSRPIRWVVAGNHDPAWIVPHSAGWASRQERICLPWDGVQVCLYELPVTP